MDFTRKEVYTIQDLKEIVAYLRDEKFGCPWDKVQDHMTIRKNFIEEVYEAVEAIDNQDSVLLREELGDVLLQVLLHSQFEDEIGVFSFDDVVNDLAQKIVIRHPHVFGEENINEEKAVLNRWEEVKNEVKGYETVGEKVNSVPKVFPSLMYAQKVQKRLQAGKVEFYDKDNQFDSIKEMLEIVQTQDDYDKNKVFGKLLFDIVNLIRCNDTDCEDVLRDYSTDFVDNFNKIEKNMLQNGLKFDKIDKDSFSKIWQEVLASENQ